MSSRALRLVPAAALLSLASACGGGDGGVTSPPPPPLEATFSSIQANILSTTCAVSGCHAGPSPQQDLDLSAGVAYGQLVNVTSKQQSAFLRVEPGNAADSYLYMKVSGDPRISDGRMPLGGVPLSTEKLEAIAMWIEAGAAND